MEYTTSAFLFRAIFHKDGMNFGIKHPCSFCGYKATDKFALRKHTDAVHKGVKYSCEQCDFQSGFKQAVKKHTDAIHDRREYFCSHCDFKTSHQTSVIRHDLSGSLKMVITLKHISWSASSYFN